MFPAPFFPLRHPRPRLRVSPKVLSAPSKTAWLTQQEASGKAIMGVPRSMELLIGG